VGQVQRVLQNLLAKHLHSQSLGLLRRSAITLRSQKIRTNFPNTPAVRLALRYQAVSSDNGGLRAITIDPRSNNNSPRVCGNRRVKLLDHRTESRPPRHGDVVKNHPADADSRTSTGDFVRAAITTGLPAVF